MSKNLVFVAMVAVLLPGGACAGGGYATDPGQMFGGLETSFGTSPAGQRPVPDQMSFQDGRRRMPGGGQHWGRPERAPHHGRHGAGQGGPSRFEGPGQPGMNQRGMGHPRRRDHQSGNSLLSPRIAMYWMRLDANARLQLETYLRQWLATLTADQNQTMLTAIQRRWERMPSFQQQFLSQLYNGATTATSAAAAPVTTTTTTVTTAAGTSAVDPTTGYAIDPTTGYSIDPTTGYLIDPATGYRIEPTTGYRIDPTTGNRIDPTTGSLIDPKTGTLIPATTTTATPATGTTVDPTTGYAVDPTTGYLIEPTTGGLIDPTTGQILGTTTSAPSTTTTTP